jgi:uncharacterized protein (DUF427 family)
VPEGLAYIEPFRRRVRATRDGATVVDSDRVLLVHRQGRSPTYAFPASDVRGVPTGAEPDAPGYVAVAWDQADAWYEENEQVFGHPRNPYHRIDCLRSSRRLRVEVGGVTTVDTDQTLVVYETALEPRLYVARGAVQAGALEPSTTQTYCPYKGAASYWNVRLGDDVFTDVAWSYEEALPESSPLEGMLSFDDARVHLEHDLPPAE